MARDVTQTDNSQHPLEATIKLGINTLKIRQCDLLSDQHLIKADNEEGIQEAPVEDSQSYAAAYESEIAEMFRVDPGCWVDLEGIVIVGRILEEAIDWIEHLV